MPNPQQFNKAARQEIGEMVRWWRRDKSRQPLPPGPTSADPQSPPFMFELTENLSAGSDAAAKVLKFDGSNWVDSGDTTRVYDSIGDKSGTTGDRGWCIRCQQSERDEIVPCLG